MASLSVSRSVPIYDQHAHRAIAKLEGWKEKEVPKSEGEKIKVYLKRYQPTFNSKYAKHGCRKADRALWTYGKFLKHGRV